MDKNSNLNTNTDKSKISVLVSRQKLNSLNIKKILTVLSVWKFLKVCFFVIMIKVDNCISKFNNIKLDFIFIN